MGPTLIGVGLEWSADCNNDGIVDYGQIRRGQLPDYDGDNIPDCCERSEPCVVGRYPLEWRMEDGGNGHWYLVDSTQRDWSVGRVYAESVGGHLVTIASEAEQNFIEVLPGVVEEGCAGPAIGLWQSPTGAEPAGGWGWITGEPLTFLAWGAIGDQIQPNDSTGGPPAGICDRAGLWCAPNHDWDDVLDTDYDLAALIEWDADCNDDGKVDYGQILRRELADANADGVPDVCDEVLNVPGRYPTIQAAIDAATPSTLQIVVSEGVYNEAIDFKGKAVTLKALGARASTVIDGTGKSTSVVRAVSGETAATVLQGFTIRNGVVGSPVSTYRLGGGMFIDQASPTIRDCTFVQNAAGYGGGIYGLYSDSLVEHCTFTQNTASTDGGGVQFSGGSPVVRNCVLTDNAATNSGGAMHLVQDDSGGFPTVDGCTITGNRTSVSHGGGVSIYPHIGGSGLPLVTNCLIQNNTAQGKGGGLHAALHPLAPTPGVSLAGNELCGNLSGSNRRENIWALFVDGGNTLCDCLSDIDGDGNVNFGDLAITLLFIGEATEPDFIQPDQDMNGVVDTGDVAVLLLNFGPCG